MRYLLFFLVCSLGIWLLKLTKAMMMVEGGNHMRVPVSSRITPTVGTVGFLFQEATQPSVP